jgi:hypothetical protein
LSGAHSHRDQGLKCRFVLLLCLGRERFDAKN